MSALLAIGRAIAAGFDWLLRHPTVAVLAILIVNVGAHQFVIDPRLRADRDTARAEKTAEIAAHQATKEAYRRAQAEAARRDAERLVRVQSEQEEITDAVTADYRARLAGARAVAERLREQLARAGERAAGPGVGEPVPATGAAAGRAAEASGDNGLPVSPPTKPDPFIELDWRLIATEQAIQLGALIDWVERQAAVSVEQPGR